jgi:Fe-S-cluster containining protein
MFCGVSGRKGASAPEGRGLMADANRCQTCGACCARFNVVIEAAEIDIQGSGGIPLCVTAKSSKKRYVMKGTEGNRKRCVALEGIVGQGVSCAIYQNRPGTCRNFLAAWEPGVINPKCDLARHAYGLFAFSLY